MRYEKGELVYSPSDLMVFMESPFASWCERLIILDPEYKKFMDPEDDVLKLLSQKGIEHENKFLQELKTDQNLNITEIQSDDNEQKRLETLAAMRNGSDIIYQGFLHNDNFNGFPDFLFKEKGGSVLGEFHYIIKDTKLAKKTKPSYVIQLCCYNEMLNKIQGKTPNAASIILGNEVEDHIKIKNYFYYYQCLKDSFLEFHENFNADKPPDPSNTKDNKRWSSYGNSLLEKHDHLSLTAGITKNQIKRLNLSGIHTYVQLSETNKEAIPRIENEIFSRLKKQSNHQIISKNQGKISYELLNNEDRALGLAVLPPHSDNDIFFDIESYPFVEGGLEYLWGVTYFDSTGKREFIDFWGHDREEEQKAFESFMEWAFKRWLDDRSLHIYHYGHYETSALKRLMGRYGVCEFEVDTFLRNQVFVDLYNVVRKGLIIGEPKYSLKNVEHLYRDARETDVQTGGESIAIYQEWRDNPDGTDWENSTTLKQIRDYNIDDCNSTQELTQWLRERQFENSIEYIGNQKEEVEENEDDIELRLLKDDLISMSESETDEVQRDILQNLAWILEFHSRENKPIWWRLFERLGSTSMDLYDDMDCLVNLKRTTKEPYQKSPRARIPFYEYSYDLMQPFKGRLRKAYILGLERKQKTIENHDTSQGLLSIQSNSQLPKIISLIPDQFVPPKPIPRAIQRVIETLLEKQFSDCALIDLFKRNRPRFQNDNGGDLIDKNDQKDVLVKKIIKLTKSLQNSYLCIQGPPGSGKTYTAKQVIGELLKDGKTIGISSNSHNAIFNLMEGVISYTEENNINANIVKHGGDQEHSIFQNSDVKYTKRPDDIDECLGLTSLCIGGTAWLFCHDKFNPDTGTQLDYLFIDEAGQVSLANLVGMSQCCKNIILMGDQMQLSQPVQGSHPGDTGLSILDYILHEHATIPSDRGVFLPNTFRMHPDLCSVISNQIYEGRLSTDLKTKNYCIETKGPLITKKSGICFIPIKHQGNTQGSEEEVLKINELVHELLGTPFWSENGNDDPRMISLNDILIVAPYNHQVNLLEENLGVDAQIGTVDRFQGKEAPIVIVSMCASDASESSRGIEFIFSKNRLNVALSRAQALAIVVGSPELAITPVTSLEQMEMINFFSLIYLNG